MSRKPVVTSASVLQFPAIRKGGPEHPLDPQPNSGCRPTLFILDADAVVAAARRKRPLKNIAAQFGVTREDVWDVVTDALARKAAA